MNLLEPALRLLAYATGGFTLLFSLLSLLAARRFKRGADAARRSADPDFNPAVTILKPVKGAEPGMYENLESFVRQDYPRFQILFCLQNPQDPGLEIVEKLRARYPSVDMEIVVSKNRIGYNPKINNLSNAYPFAKHDLLVISDSDVRVPQGFLRRAVKPMSDEKIGLVTCMYRSDGGASIGATLEALSINAQFLPKALVAGLLLGLRFAMGAVMILRRSAFEASGGFQNLSGHLADDYILGHSIAACGHGVTFSHEIVDSTPGFPSVFEAIAHLVRWARTIRVCQPAGYLGLVLIQGLPFVTLYLAVFGLFRPMVALWISIALARIAVTAWIHARYLETPNMAAQLPWIPVSDLLGFGVWLAGFRPGTVLWRGQRFDIGDSGRLIPRKTATDAAAVPVP